MSKLARLGSGAITALMLSGAPGANADIRGTAAYTVSGVVVVWAADGVGNVPIASDFIIDTGAGNSAATSGDVDLIAGSDVRTMVTGSLLPADTAVANQQGAPMRISRTPSGAFNTDTNSDGVMDADDGFSAFRVRANTDTNTRRMEIFQSFYVASNTAFSIDGTATALGATTPFQMTRMRARLQQVTLSGTDGGVSFGGASQYPHSAGPEGGRRLNNRRLSTMMTPRPVFRGDQRTAAGRGTLMEQSVRFDMRYSYASGDVDLSDGAFEAEAEVVYTVFIP